MQKSILLIVVFFLTTSLLGQSVSLSDMEIRDSLFYYNGILYTGSYNYYNDKGGLIKHGYIEKGKLDSITEYYSKNGKLTEKVWFSDNTPVKRILFENAITSNLVITLKGNVEHGLWERYFLSGQIKERKYYDNGEPDGIWTTWDKKGRKIIETDFTNDPIVTKYHGYKNNKHTVITKYIDKKSQKTIKQEKIIEPLD